MKILLTSSGITNTTIHAALVDLLGKPIAESSALCIPTGVQPFPGGPSHVYEFLTGTVGGPMCALGWKSLGVLELTALPSIKKEHWVAAVGEADALLVWGGSPLGVADPPQEPKRHDRSFSFGALTGVTGGGGRGRHVYPTTERSRRPQTPAPRSRRDRT